MCEQSKYVVDIQNRIVYGLNMLLMKLLKYFEPHLSKCLKLIFGNQQHLIKFATDTFF